jgi:uncharacterized protein (DUF2267 family)
MTTKSTPATAAIPAVHVGSDHVGEAITAYLAAGRTGALEISAEMLSVTIALAKLRRAAEAQPRRALFTASPVDQAIETSAGDIVAGLLAGGDVPDDPAESVAAAERAVHRSELTAKVFAKTDRALVGRLYASFDLATAAEAIRVALYGLLDRLRPSAAVLAAAQLDFRDPGALLDVEPGVRSAYRDCESAAEHVDVLMAAALKVWLAGTVDRDADDGDAVGLIHGFIHLAEPERGYYQFADGRQTPMGDWVWRTDGNHAQRAMRAALAPRPDPLPEVELSDEPAEPSDEPAERLTVEAAAAEPA